MARLHPGVYIQEIPSGVQPIEGVSTSTAAFIGLAEMGPVGQAQLVTSLAEFQASYGSFIPTGFLAHAVLQFFNNGGKAAYIVRVAASGATAAAISIKDRKAAPATTLTLRARNPGDWGNDIELAVSGSATDPGNLFTLTVSRNRSELNPPLPSLLLETFEDLSMDPAAANFVETAMSGSKYIAAQADPTNLTTAVGGTSRGGKLPVGNGADALKLGVANSGAEAAGTAGPPPTSGTSTSGASPSTNPAADKRRIAINLDGDGALVSEHSNELSFRQVACANLSRRHALRIPEGEQHGRKCV